MAAAFGVHERGADVRRQQRDDREVCHRPQLACEPHGGIGVGANSLKHVSFASRWPRQSVVIADNANPAGRATALAAANAGVRYVVTVARFQDRQALRHPDRPVRVGEPNHAAPPLIDAANAAGREHRNNSGGVSQQETAAQPFEVGALVDRANPRRRLDVGAPRRLKRQTLHGLGLLVKAERREHGQQHGDRKQDWRNFRKEPSQAQPEINTDTAMDPGDDNHGGLHRAQVRPCDPQSVDRLRVAPLESV